jgi:hypothetical protein
MLVQLLTELDSGGSRGHARYGQQRWHREKRGVPGPCCVVTPF